MKQLIIIFIAAITLSSCDSQEQRTHKLSLAETVAENIKNNPDDWIEIKSNQDMKVDSNLNFVGIGGDRHSNFYQNKKCGICVETSWWGTSTMITTKDGTASLNDDGITEILVAIHYWEDQKRIRAEEKILKGICK